MDCRKIIICFFLFISTASLLNNGAYAATYNVGDKLGWTVPPLDSSLAYKTWAAKQDFAVGDTIVFTWSNTHTVAQLSSKSDYDNCNATNAIGAIQNSSPASFTIDNSTSPHYFICTVGNHCDLGQKVTVTVGGGSSAASAASCALSAILLAMAVFFFTII